MQLEEPERTWGNSLKPLKTLGNTVGNARFPLVEWIGKSDQGIQQQKNLSEIQHH